MNDDAIKVTNSGSLHIDNSIHKNDILTKFCDSLTL